jgi:TolB-like protein/DNA-binding winged helix-turn-helix (wHTH) protein/Flp pilus assembly protein TadD
MPSVINRLYEFDGFCLDEQKRILLRGQKLIPLTPKAFETLLVLVHNSGRVLTKDQIMEAVWPGSFVEEANLTQTVFVLRKALGEGKNGQRYIVTMPGQGYRFTATVKQVPKDGQAALEAVWANPKLEIQPPPRKLGVWWLGVRSLILAGVVIAIAATGAFFYRSRPQVRSSASQVRLMLAVLPFDNLTGDAGQDYFSDGLTEEMITEMGRINAQRIGVIARTSVMHYKHTPAPISQIGRELGVQYILEGSVRRDAGKVRITAQLIRVRDQSHLWAQEYDRDLTDLLALQSEIAQQIGDEILTALGELKANPVPSQFSLSPETYEAYDLYLRGLFFWNKRTNEGFQRAIDYFQQAIGKDPRNARAYAGLANSYSLLSAYSAAPADELMPKARAAAKQALHLDDRLPEAHTALALIVQNYNCDWQSAEREYRRAIELNPNYATAHHWYAEHLMWRGRFDEALRESERARQLDPLSLIIATDNGAILYFSRQYERAVAQLRTVLEMDPDFDRANYLMIAAYAQQGMSAKAIADLEKTGPAVDDKVYWSTLAYIHGRSGERELAQLAMSRLLEPKAHEPTNPALLVSAYVGLGKKEEALVNLEKASGQHSNFMTTLKVNPVLDPLRDDPRFQELLERVGLRK